MHYGRKLESWEITDFDLKNYPVWVRTPAHTEPVMTPLYCEFWYGLMVSGIRRGAAYMSLPTTKGYYWKLHKGHGYLTRAIPRDEEIPQREAVYRKRLTEIVKDPFGYCDKLFADFDELMEPFAALKVEEMSREELIGHIYDIINLHVQSIYRYFQGWFAITPLPALFQRLAGELTGLKSTDPEYSELIRGIDNPLYRSNAGLAELASFVLDLKLEDNFKLPDNKVISAMQESEPGKKWVSKLNEFIARDGWRLMRMYEFCNPGWYEDHNLVVTEVRRYLETGGVHAADHERNNMVKRSEELKRELIAKVPESQRDWFEMLLVCTQAANYWSEGAAWHGEFKRMAFGRRCFIECGKRMAEDGTIEKVDDVFMLFTDEIISAIGNREKGRYIALVNERRKEWENYKSISITDDVPQVLGDPNAIGEMLKLDPTLSVSISQPVDSPENVGALAVGGAGSPGVVEGTARVIFDESQWDQLQTGDIMVTPMTSATWTPLFGSIKGLVCDSGGSLSHPVIVSREYGIPAVVGCVDATRKIKSGDNIRVDGDLLRVYKLD